jgi:methenyltetrahydrofolate cyclohydrolase
VKVRIRAVATTVTDFLAQPLEELLEEIASDKPAPGGGAVAAIVVAMAAGLVAMAARFSREWEEADEVCERADALRRRVAPLAPADAAAFEEVLTAMRLPKHLEPEVRNTAIGNALARAAEIPLEIAKEASEVAVLGALAAEKGNPNLRGDAVAATFLAHAAARVAANLVTINLGTTERDERVARAREHVAAAEEAVERALAVGP